MAMGSRRTRPVLPSAAEVVSDPIVAPRYTPWIQLKAWKIKGTLVARRPPNTMAEMGTPAGSSQAGSMDGHCEAGAVNRELGWAAGVPCPGVHGLPRQSVMGPGGGSPMPSHHTSPSAVSATLVKMLLRVMLFM